MAADTDAGAVRDLAALLRETERAHAAFEADHEDHDWQDWYAAYLVARRRGEEPAAATGSARRYLEDVLGVRPR